MASKKRLESILVAVVLFAFCGFFLYKASLLPGEAAFFPKAILYLMTGLTAIMLVKDLMDIKSGKNTEAPKIAAKDLAAPPLMFLGVTAFVVLFRLFGYFPASIVLFVGLMLVLKVKPRWMIAAITAGYLVFIYLMFVKWLQVSLM